MRKSGIVKISLFFTVACLWTAVAAADIDTLKANTIAYFTGAGADTNDPIVAQALTDLENSARTFMKNCLPRGGWPDIDYTIPLAYGGEWQAIGHYSRMKQMALAYATPGQGLYRSDSIVMAMELALDSIHDLVYSGVNRINNWWYWYQGIPMYFGPALLLMQGHVDSAIFAQAAAALKWCLDYFPVNQLGGSAGDLVTQGLGNLYYGALSGDTLYLNRARWAAQTELTVHDAPDGILPDWSCVHHGDQLYIGGYGAQVAADGPKYLLMTRATRWALPQANFDVITGFNAFGTAWCLYHNIYDVSVIGRSITRRFSYDTYGLTALLLMAGAEGPYKGLFQQAAQKMLLTWNASLPVDVAAYASQVKQSGAEASWPLGHKNYWSTYFTVHKRAGYHMSVKMMGPGITGSELVNNEGKKSWHLSDGMTWILRNGDEYNKNDVIPCLDWNRLPGITVQKKSYPLGDVHSNPRPFVGGVECGQYGASAMDFSSSGEQAAARKSWFFFDNEMVCLGSAVNCPALDTCETVINQRPLSGTGLPLVVDNATVSTGVGFAGKASSASWAACDSMGYFFPGGADLCWKTADQSGRWSDLGIGDNTLRTNPMVTLWFNHGVNTAGAAYAYAVLPNRSSQDMAAYSVSPAFRILENSDTLHAVEHPGLSAFGAVFWKPGQRGLVQADSPSIVFCRASGDSFYFSAAYPPRRSATIRFRVDAPLSLISSNRALTVSTDSLTTVLSYVSPGNGNGLVALLRRIPRASGYVRITLTDSASGLPLAGALCAVSKGFSNTAYTDSMGIAVIRADTGYNRVTAKKAGWVLGSLEQVAVRPGETTDVAFSVPRLMASGLRIAPTPVIAGVLDHMNLTALCTYPDSSADTLANGLIWSVEPDSLGSVDSVGRLVTGWPSGTGVVRCSSMVLGFSAIAPLTVRPVYLARPVADAYTRGGSYAANNYGLDSVLTIKGSSDLSYTRRVFLKFDLTAIAGAIVDSSCLRIYAASAVSTNVSVNRVADTGWQETALTWSNQPALGAPADTIATGNAAGWKRADMGAALDSILTLGLYNPANDDVYLDFKSRESSMPPVLEVYARKGSSGNETDAYHGPVMLAMTPNPFNPCLKIQILGWKGLGEARVYSPQGRLVARLALEKGATQWNAQGMSSGLYFIRVLTGKQVFEKKAVLMR